jgi:hypothetical protein
MAWITEFCGMILLLFPDSVESLVLLRGSGNRYPSLSELSVGEEYLGVPVCLMGDSWISASFTEPKGDSFWDVPCDWFGDFFGDVP